MFNFLKKYKPGEEKLWQQFRGKGNSKDILIEKAKTLAPIIIKLSVDCTEQTLKALKETKNLSKKYANVDDKFEEVTFEILLLHLHFIDRIAFQHLGPESRNTFMDAVLIEIKKQLSHLYAIGKDSFMRMRDKGDNLDLDTSYHLSYLGYHLRYLRKMIYCLYDAYNDRQIEYSKYKKVFARENDKGMKGTLSWEFGKKLAKILGYEWDLVVISTFTMCAQSVLYALETFLQLPELFQE